MPGPRNYHVLVALFHAPRLYELILEYETSDMVDFTRNPHRVLYQSTHDCPSRSLNNSTHPSNLQNFSFKSPPFVLPPPDGPLYVPLVYSVQRPSTLSTIRKTGKPSSPSFIYSPLKQFDQNTEALCFSQSLCSFWSPECWLPLGKRQSVVTKPALTMGMIITLLLIS